MSTRILALAALIVATACAPASAAGETAAKDWGPITVRERSIAPGTKEKFFFVPFRTFEGGYLDTPIWVARGRRAGATLCVVGGIHGDELNGPEIARRTFAAADPAELAGTLIVLPAVNVFGFRTGNRYMPDRRDLNRSFPGDRDGSVAAIVAQAAFEVIRSHCNALVDLHTGSFQRTNLPQIRVDLANARALELARRFGVGIVLGGAGPRGSLRRESMEAGIPAVIYEAGEPLRFQVEEIERGVEGVHNLMTFLGLVARAGGEPPLARVYPRSSWVRVPFAQGGIFFPTLALGTRVAKGDVLGVVTQPDTDEAHEITAPRDGELIGMAVPQVVLSGYGLFHLGYGAE
jgi:predicted deacylase